MNRPVLIFPLATALVAVAFFTAPVNATEPSPMPTHLQPWEHSAAENDLRNQPARDAMKGPIAEGESRATAQRYGGYDNAIKGGKALDKGIGSGKTIIDLAKAANGAYGPLSKGDGDLAPNYEPQGAPSVPSKCMENPDCRPCYEKAYKGVNKTRINLERVRARYAFAHRFTTQGTAFMQGVANVAGGAAALGAQVETIKVNSAVSEFDQVVRKKNTELLGVLKGNLQEVSSCEAKYYKNDDWYDRYGYIYYQFMVAHYDYVQASK